MRIKDKRHINKKFRNRDKEKKRNKNYYHNSRRQWKEEKQVNKAENLHENQ
jgi:hypothetical protein